jgi:hypothetical protein
VDLARAMDTAFVHTRPGGVTVFAPDCVRETFRPRTDHGGHDGDRRALRYLDWTHDPDPADTSYIVDYAYLLLEDGALPRCVHDRHVEGLFGREVWRRRLTEAGFDRVSIRALEHSEVEPGEVEVFVAVKPGG